MWDNIQCIDSIDSNVSKYVFTKGDAIAESVLYKYPDYETRTVICCSTQSGCPIGCRFCGAGDYFVRSLTSEEIVSQPIYLLKHRGIDVSKVKRIQIMFMSMGEPLLNLKHLIRALKELYNLYPNAALLLSTSAPQIDYALVREISRRIPTIGLQFSVHESTDAQRDKLIPFTKKLSLDQISVEGLLWGEATGRKPFFNYCVHEKNGTDTDADNLFHHFDPVKWEATISVVCERNDGFPATSEHQRNLAIDFSQKLISRGYSVRVFDPAGQDDIGGGCGQLWFVQNWMKNNSELARPSIGHGLEAVHAPVQQPQVV